jgi:hypothetical protein
MDKWDYMKLQRFCMWGVDYAKSMRIWHKHSCAQWSACWVWQGPSCICSTAAFPKLFTVREGGTQVSLVTMSHSFLRTVSLPPYFPLGIKRLVERGCEAFWWVILIAWCWLLCVSTRAAFCTENFIHTLQKS